MNRLSKGSFNYLIKSKDTIFSCLSVIVFGVLLLAVIYFGDFNDNINYRLFISYILLLSLTVLQSNSMITDLTLKDKMSSRLEFFLSSGFKLKEIVVAYSFQMMFISMVIPLLFFVFIIANINYSVSYVQIFFLMFTTLVLCFLVILFMNIISLTIKRIDNFKSILFFTTFLIIYLLGQFSSSIVNIISNNSWSIMKILTLLNIVLIVIMSIIILNKLKKIDYESIDRGKNYDKKDNDSEY